MTDAEFNARLDALEARIVADYVQQASKLRNSITLGEITAMIRAGEIVKILRAFDGGDYSQLLEDVRRAYLQGGADAVEELSRAAVGYVRDVTGARVLGFDAMRQEAADWVAQNAAGIVRGFAAEQAGAVELTITSGYAGGLGAPQIARNLLGISNPAIGEGFGGVVGLGRQDAEWLASARAQLMSGDPVQMRAYFDRVLRDRRFDGIVQRAIDAGEPVSINDIDKITQRYAERLLTNRADVVATIEVNKAYNTGRQQFYRQILAEGVPAEKITKRWKTRKDNKVRDQHRAMEGQTVQGDAFFVAPDGSRMLNPGDMEHGAPLSQVARCRCRAVYTVEGE